MANYLERVQYLYPDIDRVVFWHTQYDGTLWKDEYDGLVWENTKITKPTKQKLDSLNADKVIEELNRRHAQRKKQALIQNNPTQQLEDTISQTNAEVQILRSEMIKNQQKMESFMKVVSDQNQEMNSMIIALKGFLMEIPNIQKSLLDVNAVLQKKST